MRFGSRRRLGFLAIVNGLILIHVVAYYGFDQRQVGCIDVFGLATFAGKGAITAGTLFLFALVGLTLLLGRIFCGWGCHFAFFQDLFSRFLARIGVRPAYRRGRLEYVIPPLLVVVTLAYPIIAWWNQNGLPHGISYDMAYPDLWHLLPGAKGVSLILLVDVVLLGLLFGNRAFCRYVCPYGLLLKGFHALSPMRVVKVGACDDCGSCGRVCPAGVPIKHELGTYGLIRDLNCMNCGDCLAACPSEAIALRPTKKAYRHPFEGGALRNKEPYWVDAAILAPVILALMFFRGRDVGDFLAAGLGLLMGACVIAVISPRRIVSARMLATEKSLRIVRVATSCLAAFLALGMAGQAATKHVVESTKAHLPGGDHVALAASYARLVPVVRALRPFTFYLDSFDNCEPPRFFRRLG